MIPKSFQMLDLDKKLQSAVDAYDLSVRGDFAKLAELSDRTVYDGIDVHSDASVIVGDRYFAPATVFVTLNYGNGEESWSDSYPARVDFSLVEDEVRINSVDVDTSDFHI